MNRKLLIISLILTLGIGDSSIILAASQAKKNKGDKNLRGSAAKHNSELLGEVKDFLLDGRDRDAGEVDRIEKQAEEIAKGDIKGLTLDEKGRLIGEEEYLKGLRLKLGEIFVGECKKITKEKKAGKIYKFWGVVEKDRVFLEEIGRDFLDNMIRFGQRHSKLLNNLALWEYLGVKRYFEEKGLPVEQGEIKQEAKNIVLGALHPWQFTKKGRLVLRDSFIVEEMRKRGNEGAVMDIGIAAGISMHWYASGKFTESIEETLPGITFIELADKLAGKKIKLIGVDIETAGLEGLLKEIREEKVEEALKKRYLNSQIDYLRCDLTKKLPVRDESFDIISAAHVFPYIAQDKLKIESLLNIWQALKKEGLLLFVDPDPESVKHHIVKDEKGEIIKVNPIKSDYEVYKKDKAGLTYQGRLSWNEAKTRAILKKGEEMPLLDKYLPILQASLDKKLDEGIASAHLVVLGMTHKTASRDVRDRFIFAKEDMPFHLKTLKEKKGVKEVMILKTCNRREIYMVTDKPEETKEMLYNFLYSFFPEKINKEDLKKQVFVKSDKDALAHLFLVTCGLDALAIGETQIVGQVKTAYEEAKKEKAAGGILEKVFTEAIKMNHIIRNRFPEISKGDISVSGLAVKKAKNILGDLKGKICLLVGSGEVQHETWEHLQGRGLKEVIIVSRSLESAQELADHIREEHTNTGSTIKVEAASYSEKEKFIELFKKADIVLTATDFPHKPLIHRGFVEKVMKARKNKPLVFIDMGDPIDVDGGVNEIKGVSHYSSDELQDVVGNHQDVVKQGSSIINYAADRSWQKLVKKKEIFPVVSSLKEIGNVWGKWQRYYLDDYSSLLSPEAKLYLKETLKSFTNKCMGSLRRNLNEIEPSLQKEAVKYLSLFWCEKDVGKDFSHYSLSQPVVFDLKREWREIFYQEMIAAHTNILSFNPQEQEFIQDTGDKLIYSLLACIDKALTEVGSQNRKDAGKYAGRFLKQKPLADKYLHIPFWARAVFPDINVRRSAQELTELGDLNKQRAMILNEELFMDNPGAIFHIINTNRQLTKEKGLKLVLALSNPDQADIFYEAIKEAADGDIDLKGQFDYVVSARKKAKAVVRDVQNRFPELESIEVIGPESWAKDYKALKIGKGADAKQCIVIVCGLGKGNYIANGAGAFEYGLKALLLDTGILGFEDTEKIARLRDKKTGFFVIKAKKVGKETQAIIKRYRTVLGSK